MLLLCEDCVVELGREEIFIGSSRCELFWEEYEIKYEGFVIHEGSHLLFWKLAIKICACLSGGKSVGS